MNPIIRKQFPNYLLPSEFLHEFRAMIGNKFASIKIGTRTSLPIDTQKIYNYPDSLIDLLLSQDNPIFLTTVSKKTYIFYSDEFTASISVKLSLDNIDSADFCDQFYKDDNNTPSFLKIKSIVDVTEYCREFIDKELKSINILKLPTNFFGKPTSWDEINEVGIVFSLQDSEDLIIGYGMKKDKSGHCLLSWSSVKSDFPLDKISCLPV